MIDPVSVLSFSGKPTKRERRKSHLFLLFWQPSYLTSVSLLYPVPRYSSFAYTLYPSVLQAASSLCFSRLLLSFHKVSSHTSWSVLFVCHSCLQPKCVSMAEKPSHISQHSLTLSAGPFLLVWSCNSNLFIPYPLVNSRVYKLHMFSPRLVTNHCSEWFKRQLIQNRSSMGGPQYGKNAWINTKNRWSCNGDNDIRK